MTQTYTTSLSAHAGSTLSSRCQAYVRHVAVTLGMVAAMGAFGTNANATTAEELNVDAVQALHALYRTSPEAEAIGAKAKAILIFPKVTKAGLVFGGSYGEGVLMKGQNFSGYYNTISASWGWQAGAQSYGYVVFLMSDKALSYLNASKGWELGVDPSVVVVNQGAAKNLSSTTLKGNAYAFVFDQQGLMGSVSIEGTKISRIAR